MGYAAVLGEALVDLLEGRLDGEPVYRPAIGGGPLNVAVGVARLGGDARFVGSLGDDVWGERIAQFLAGTGVDVSGTRRVAAATTLAVTTFTGPEPQFRFYGEPPSYALLSPDDVDIDLIAGAAVVYAGSISLLREPFLGAARRAWAVPGPLKVFDPNVRPTLLPDAAAVARLRDQAEQFASTADVVKLSAADASVLYGGTVPEAAARLQAAGAAAVVVTCGGEGAVLAVGGEVVSVPAPVVTAIDATGAGDSVMAALIFRLLTEGRPAEIGRWRDDLRFALAVAATVCERRGGAVAMPTAEELARRWAPAGR